MIKSIFFLLVLMSSNFLFAIFPGQIVAAETKEGGDCFLLCCRGGKTIFPISLLAKERHTWLERIKSFKGALEVGVVFDSSGKNPEEIFLIGKKRASYSKAEAELGISAKLKHPLFKTPILFRGDSEYDFYSERRGNQVFYFQVGQGNEPVNVTPFRGPESVRCTGVVVSLETIRESEFMRFVFPKKTPFLSVLLPIGLFQNRTNKRLIYRLKGSSKRAVVSVSRGFDGSIGDLEVQVQPY